MQRHTIIPLIVFVVTFVVTIALVILVAYVWNPETALTPVNGIKAMPPFPNVSPVVPAPLTDPMVNICVNLVGNAQGMYVPSPQERLRACTTDAQCSDCHVGPAEIDALLKPTLACASPTADVAAQQAGLGNDASKFCLPTPRACLPPNSDAFIACTHDAECASCTDVLGDGIGMQCEIVSKPKTIAHENNTINVPAGKWCLPRTGECDVNNGVLNWTTAGWKCMCKYPSIHTGESCEITKACNSYLTTPWSRDKQHLLINAPTATYEVWDISSGVNPELCHEQDEHDRTRWNRVCSTDSTTLVPNTVCRCDGLMLDAHIGFRTDPENPLTCLVDNCSVTALGGRTREPLALVQWTTDQNIPPNQCICSGANSRIWDSDPRNPDTVEATDPALADALRNQEGYVYRGRCNSVTLPRSMITLHPDTDRVNSAICQAASNSAAATSLLVPGLASDVNGEATINVCSADPCTGNYSDLRVRAPADATNWGHYDAGKGSCSCANPAANVQTACDPVVNPVCSVCTNACLGMESANPEHWPCRQHPLRPCDVKPECITDSEGQAQCVCATGCGNTDGRTCAAQFNEGEGCFGYVGVPNICVADDGGYAECKCHRGKFANGLSLGVLGGIGMYCTDSTSYYAMCTTTTSTQPTCRRNNMSGVTCAGSNCPEVPGCDQFNV